MWVLDDIRIKQLAKYGVKNNEFMRLHEDARASLLKARQFLNENDYSGFKSATREAWGLEGRGYPEIKSTADDTVYGVIFYFALLLPFSFCCERLFFGHSDVRKQLFTSAVFYSHFWDYAFHSPRFQAEQFSLYNLFGICNFCNW